MTRERAEGSGWVFRDDGCGTITRALDEWIITDRDQRAFMEASLTLATAHWSKISEEVTTMPISDGGPDHADLLFDRLGGLMPDEYEWMLLSGVLKDAVTAYEVYLTNAMDEVLRSQGLQRNDQTRTPSWEQFDAFYAILGLKPRAHGVSHVVRLRNVLTHVRGRLRTKKDRARYGQESSGMFSSDVAHLDEKSVTRHMGTLGRAACELDPVLWAYAWKRANQIPRELLITEAMDETPPPDPDLEQFADLVPD
jgi:hypothetical protein